MEQFIEYTKVGQGLEPHKASLGNKESRPEKVTIINHIQ